MSTTSEPTADPLPPQRPLERFTHLETDIFCEGCGYNLHGQPVHRDDRLGIMICRCPECGRFHPAGHGTAATSLWMSRLAAWLLVLWVALVVATFGFACIGFGALQIFPIEIFTSGTGKLMSVDGREVAYVTGPNSRHVPVFVGTTQPADAYTIAYRYSVRELPQVRFPWRIFGVLFLLSAGIGIVSGGLLVTFVWHWPHRRYRWAAILPLLTAVVVAGIYQLNEPYLLIRSFCFSSIFVSGIVQTVFVLIGLGIGRPIARLVLRMFVPPKPRQQFAFLWKIDGKTPPPATFEQQGA